MFILPFKVWLYVVVPVLTIGWTVFAWIETRDLTATAVMFLGMLGTFAVLGLFAAFMHGDPDR